MIRPSLRRVIKHLKILLFGLVALACMALLRYFTHPRPLARPQPRGASMEVKEAIAVLGLETVEPTPEAVISAHRRLMQRLHPDKGGSAHLAQQLNEAKRVLLAHNPAN